MRMPSLHRWPYYWRKSLLLAVVLILSSIAPSASARVAPWKQNQHNAGGIRPSATTDDERFLLTNNNPPPAVSTRGKGDDSSVSEQLKTNMTDSRIIVTSIWQEEDFPDESSTKKPTTKQPRRKNRFWWGSLAELLQQGRPLHHLEAGSPAYDLLRSAGMMDDEKEPVTEPPHPLRTDEWQLTLHWRQRPHTRRTKKDRLFLEFAENGYVRTVVPSSESADRDDQKGPPRVDQRSSSDADEPLVVGTWKLGAAGLSWKLQLDGDEQEYLFVADLHPNPFGTQPKLTRGIVLQQGSASSWFRPIVGTFTGRGIGQDTADLSYRNRRGFGSS